MKKISKILWIIALILVIVLIAGLSYGYYKKITMEVKNPVATMEVENFRNSKNRIIPK